LAPLLGVKLAAGERIEGSRRIDFVCLLYLLAERAQLELSAALARSLAGKPLEVGLRSQLWPLEAPSDLQRGHWRRPLLKPERRLSLSALLQLQPEPRVRRAEGREFIHLLRRSAMTTPLGASLVSRPAGCCALRLAGGERAALEQDSAVGVGAAALS